MRLRACGLFGSKNRGNCGREGYPKVCQVLFSLGFPYAASAKSSSASSSARFFEAEQARERQIFGLSASREFCVKKGVRLFENCQPPSYSRPSITDIGTATTVPSPFPLTLKPPPPPQRSRHLYIYMYILKKIPHQKY